MAADLCARADAAHREPVGVAYATSFADGDPDAHGQPVTEPDDAATDHGTAVTDAHDDQPQPVAQSLTDGRRLPGGRQERARRG